jgi:hypothetical protein
MVEGSYKLADISAEIREMIGKFGKDMEAIKSLKTEFEGQIKDKYIETLDLGVALGEERRLEEQKKRLEEAEARNKAEKERIFSEGLSGVAMRLQSPMKSEEEARQEIRFKVYVTKEQKEMLKKFMVENGIEYDRI